MVVQQPIGGRDVAPIGAGLPGPRALPVGLHEAAAPQTCVMGIRHIHTDAGWFPIAGGVRVTLQNPRTQVAYGDDVLAEGDLSFPPFPQTPIQDYDDHDTSILLRHSETSAFRC